MARFVHRSADTSQLLGEGLGSNVYVAQLFLSHNPIGGAGAAALCASLAPTNAGFSSVSVLDLRHCNIDDTGGESIGLSFRGNTLEDWGFTDAELLNITLGDKEDIPYFLRTVIFDILRPYTLETGNNSASEEAKKFLIKFMLDFDEYTPGSKQAIEQLNKYIGHLDPNEPPLAATVKEIRVDFFRRQYDNDLKKAEFDSYFDGDKDVLPDSFAVFRDYLPKIPGCIIIKDIAEIAGYLFDKEVR